MASVLWLWKKGDGKTSLNVNCGWQNNATDADGKDDLCGHQDSVCKCTFGSLQSTEKTGLSGHIRGCVLTWAFANPWPGVVFYSFWTQVLICCSVSLCLFLNKLSCELFIYFALSYRHGLVCASPTPVGRQKFVEGGFSGMDRVLNKAVSPLVFPQRAVYSPWVRTSADHLICI